MLIEIPDEYFTEEELKNTPRRWKRFLEEFDDTEKFNFTTFENVDNYNEMVVVSDIPFYSLCSHHLLTFFGKANVAYIPDKRIVGISKIPRTVRYFASRPQQQERLTQQIANFLMEKLEPKGVMVVLKGRHMCMESRGIRSHAAQTTTSAITGVFEKLETRTEALNLMNNDKE